MKIKITIIGFGNVGKAIAHQLIYFKDISFTINIIDPSDQIMGGWLDLNQANTIKNNHNFVLNDNELFNHSEFIFHCAGVGVPKGASRLEIVNENKVITNQIFKDFKPKVDTKIIVVTNPVEVITHQVYLATQLPKEKIMGTGTFLDSVRMNYYVKDYLNKNQAVDFVLLGEHGESIFISDSLSTIDAKPFHDFFDKEIIETCLRLTKNAASTIKLTQGASIYAVADCAVFMMEQIIHDSKITLPVSVIINQETQKLLETNELCLSLPCEINSNGIFQKEINFTSNEIECLKKSAKQLSQFI